MTTLANGTRVKAKRLGWDEQLTEAQLWDFDSYEHKSDDLEGELQQYEVHNEETGTLKICLVDGQEADASTIQPIE